MSERFKFSKAYPSPYLREPDLEGKEATLTIKGWRYIDEKKDKGSDGRPMKGTPISFEETPKELILNVGNFNTIKSMYGSDPDNWTGEKIILMPQTTKLKGETVPCIRIRPVIKPRSEVKDPFHK